MTYSVTLINCNTAENLTVDIDQESALDAQRVAEDLYEGYRVIRIVLFDTAPAIADQRLILSCLTTI